MEALLLGLSSGLVCVASCGPVLVPWLLVERRSFRGTAALVGVFLAGRLVGYMGFAVLAWTLGLMLSARAGARATLFGAAHVALAVMLLVYAARPRGQVERSCQFARQQARAEKLRRTFRSLTPAVLGLLTGLAICPPFVAATVRAAERSNLLGAVLFFVLFFMGTTVWFLPFVAVGSVRRSDAVVIVARIATAIVGGWYAYLGATTLGARLFHG